MKEINDSSLNQEISDGVTLVDFWATWCGPCKMLSPVLDELSKELKDVKFGKVNVDHNPAVSQQFRIASIPTLLLFKNGEVVDKIVGFRPKAEIEQFIKKHI
ncbi:thioredoxin [Clostridium frigidicarnis]|uniref:Thioredoxin n=1 Tax=Clostridium frigidicarnis TaxID=84698 RepID=A0A1I0Z8J2_9CLOT|nr:thioredoxin [Clostridium frigidicarnis]SFB20553.1 thioredoxin [Clostridium frigidicarnis]